jgi:peptidoglycan/LPS O-acetylase OafA/YrhL
MTALTVRRASGWLGVVFFLGSGVWAFVAPRSFFDNLATFEPYNRHFLHDIGAFSIGLGAVLAFALLTTWDTLRVALAGIAVGSVFHVIAHAIDTEQGGKDTDVPGLAVVALVFIIGAVAGRVPGRDRVDA